MPLTTRTARVDAPPAPGRRSGGAGPRAGRGPSGDAAHAVASATTASTRLGAAAALEAELRRDRRCRVGTRSLRAVPGSQPRRRASAERVVSPQRDPGEHRSADGARRPARRPPVADQPMLFAPLEDGRRGALARSATPRHTTCCFRRPRLRRARRRRSRRRPRPARRQRRRRDRRVLRRRPGRSATGAARPTTGWAPCELGTCAVGRPLAVAARAPPSADLDAGHALVRRLPDGARRCPSEVGAAARGC